MNKIKLLLAAIIILLISSSCEKEEVKPELKQKPLWMTGEFQKLKYIEQSGYIDLYYVNKNTNDTTISKGQLRIYEDDTYKIQIRSGLFIPMPQRAGISFYVDCKADGLTLNNRVRISGTNRGLSGHANLTNGQEFVEFIRNHDDVNCHGSMNSSGYNFEVWYSIDSRGVNDYLFK